MFSASNALFDLFKKIKTKETNAITIKRQRPYRKNRALGIFPFVP